VTPYSNFIASENLVFLSGQIGTSSANEGHKDFSSEVRNTIENISNNLKQAGTSLDKVISVTVYLTDIRQFKEFNDTYLEYFNAPYPVRTCVGVKELVLNSSIEITVIAER
jgi:2-iminobutanoate/2-iminopropanoate deaminase